MGNYYITQEAHPRALWWPRQLGWGRKESQKGGDIDNYDWYTLMYGRDHHNTVKQLSSNKKKKNYAS